MATYLLTWNSDPLNWNELDEDIIKIQQKGSLEGRWSCGNNKRIIKDDRFFLIKLGKEPRGIVASGWTKSDSYQDEHWNEERALNGDKANYVEVKFDTILESTKLLPYKDLEKGVLKKMHWSSNASGITINQEIAKKLEDVWAKFLGRLKVSRENIFPEEAETEYTSKEGAKKTITVNCYERDKQAREICINRFKPICSVCNFDFEKIYGEIGKGFIHVHHLKSLSEIGQEYTLNAIEDLRPVCPNCHAMLHKKKPKAYTIEELKRIIKK
jgi:5-methylcytosine-specific restriction enzyme A